MISWKTVSAGASNGGELGFSAGTYADSSKGAYGKAISGVGKREEVHDSGNTDTP